MKKSLICSGLVLLGAVASTQVAAQQNAGSGFFVSGNAGRSQFNIGDGLGKKNDFVAGVSVGYSFNPNVAVEAGFNDYGKVEFGGVNGKARATHASLLLSAPIANAFSVYGRLGASSTDRQVSGFGSSGTDRKTEGLYGVGVGYNFAKNVQGTVEYQQLQDSEVRAVAAGVKYRF